MPLSLIKNNRDSRNIIKLNTARPRTASNPFCVIFSITPTKIAPSFSCHPKVTITNAPLSSLTEPTVVHLIFLTCIGDRSKHPSPLLKHRSKTRLLPPRNPFRPRIPSEESSPSATLALKNVLTLQTIAPAMALPTKGSSIQPPKKRGTATLVIAPPPFKQTSTVRRQHNGVDQLVRRRTLVCRSGSCLDSRYYSSR